MRNGSGNRSVIGETISITTHGNVHISHDTKHVIFIDAKVNTGHASVTLIQNVQDCIHRSQFQLLGQLRHCISFPFGMMTMGARDKNCLRPSSVLHFRLCLFPQLLSRGTEPLKHLSNPSGVGPVGQQGGHGGGRCGVWILITGDIGSPLPDGINFPQKLSRTAPLWLPHQFKVGNLQMYTRAEGNAEHLIHRFKNVRSLVAHMNRKQCFVFLKHFRQLHQLLLRSIGARWIDEPQRHAEGTRLKLMGQKRLHVLQFQAGRGAVLKPHHCRPQGPVAYEHPIVRSTAVVLYGPPIVLQMIQAVEPQVSYR